jgi:hypothetical protein
MNYASFIQFFFQEKFKFQNSRHFENYQIPSSCYVSEISNHSPLAPILTAN